MDVCRLPVIALTLCLACGELVAQSGVLRITRVEAFNAANRQPTVWLDQGPAIDVSMNQPLELQAEPGRHTITIATRLPADPTQFMQRRQEEIFVAPGQLIEVQLTWVANLFAGRHEVKVTPGPVPVVEPVVSHARISPPAARQGWDTEKAARSYASGDKYEGEMANGQSHGKGLYTWASGHSYEGDFVSGMSHGRGTYKFVNGDRYDGEVANGKFSGKGILTWASGHRYIGDFVDGKRTGRGVFETSKGGRYDGYFVDGKFEGEGELVTESGSRRRGIFRDGKLVEGLKAWEPIQAPTASTTESPMSAGETAALLLELFGSFAKGRYGDRSSSTINCTSFVIGHTIDTTCK